MYTSILKPKYTDIILETENTFSIKRKEYSHWIETQISKCNRVLSQENIIVVLMFTILRLKKH